MQFLARSLSKSIRPSSNLTARQSWVLSQQCLSTLSAKSSRTRGGGRAVKTESVTLEKSEPATPEKSEPVTPEKSEPVTPEKLEPFTPEKSVEWSRPMEIPYQPKIANSVDLIGYVHQPVQFNALDGNFWAGTVISHGPSSDSESESESDSARKFWIPVIFEGDLAHTASFHLKKNDRVHITGQVLVDAFPSGANPGRECVQVMVRDLHYIEGSKTAPKVLPTTDKKDVLKHSASLLKGSGFGTDGWFDLLDKPGEWCDYRESKQNGLVNPRHPDFKKKDGSLALWLQNAPKEISSDLKDMKFEIPVRSKYAKQQKGEESWKNLVDNMNKWWDNRLDKRNIKSPDFKNKETGEGLWLSDSPSWVIDKLPPPKSKTSDGY